MDMKSMVAILGAPETIWMVRGTQALADYYKIPCRTGGSLTDSHLVDAQSLMDGALIMQASLYEGAHFIMHSFGMVGGYIGMSPEKFVIDEELAQFIIATLHKPEVSEKTMELKVIKELGPGGDYLTHPSTLRKFRTLFRPSFLNRSSPEGWAAKGSLSSFQQARREIERRVSVWEKPPLDPKLEQELHKYAQSQGADF
jgi:trimethylamine--corrinoid protein Co-methyltransferase